MLIAVFKVVKLLLIWEFFCDFSCWTPRHGQKDPMKEGLSFRLSVHFIVGPSSCLSISFLRIGSFVLGFFLNLARAGIKRSWFVNHKVNSIFHASFFPKCDKLKIIRVGDMSVYLFKFKASLRYFLSIFYYFCQMIAFQKLWKMFFISSKKFFSFSRYLNFFIFSLPFYTFQIEKDKWKWNNLCHVLACINLPM